jgi:hypothetical protein
MKAGMAIGNHGAMLVSITLDHLRPLYENALESQLKS